MIVHQCEQGSAEWLRLRAGIPTASQFHRIITPGGKPSAQWEGYMDHLLAEWLLGEPLVSDDTQFMERGKDLEDAAIDYYEMQSDAEVTRVGFVALDDGSAGCSPDGLIEPHGGMELKCPAPGTHVGYLLRGAGDKYRWQVQGNLWIAEREWWDFLSYHPTMRPAVVRVPRDETAIKQLATAVRSFTDAMAEAKEQLLAQGFEPMLKAAA